MLSRLSSKDYPTIDTSSPKGLVDVTFEKMMPAYIFSVGKTKLLEELLFEMAQQQAVIDNIKQKLSNKHDPAV